MEELRQKIKNSEVYIKNKMSEYSSLDKRIFDIAHKAVNSKELDRLAENTTSRTIQDYILLKITFFYGKGL